MKKTAVLFLSFIIMVGMLAACQPAGSTQPTSPDSSPTTAPSVAAAFPVTVQNASDEDVTIDQSPEAIVITNVWAAEILLDLIGSDRIVGLSAWGDNPAVSPVADKAAAVETRVATGQPEGIVALNPDLIILDSFSDFDGSLARTLGDAGATVLSMNSPTSFEEIKAAIATLAAAVGEPAKGQQMIDDIDAKLEAVSDRLTDLAPGDRLKVMFYDAALDANGNDTGMLCAYGAGSPFDAIAEASGLINVVDVVTYSSVSKEKVVAEWKPDVLVVSGLAYAADFSVTDDHGAAMIEAIKASDLLATLPAVQNEKVLALTARYAGSTSHYMADAVYELAAAAYPERFN